MEDAKVTVKKSKTIKSRRESAVQGTNDSSIVSKSSMAMQGYFDDPYLGVQCFVSKVTRRAPLIHRGYYVRAKTLDYILKTFLGENPGKKQIISLGAGFDSAFFRLHAQNLLTDTIFYEIDFPEVVKRKHALIKENTELRTMIGEIDNLLVEKSPLIELSTKWYKLLGVDLSQINTLEAVLNLCHIDLDAPTLLLSECVLTYMTRRCASAVIKWAGETFNNSMFVLYEQVEALSFIFTEGNGFSHGSDLGQDTSMAWPSPSEAKDIHEINPDDAFGLFMQHHFHTVGSPLKSINAFPTLQSQRERFTKLGWNDVVALDMNQFYFSLLSSEERDRVENLEPFDEYEEWHLKCAHYMVLCGYRGNCARLLSEVQPLCSEADSPDIEDSTDIIRYTTLAPEHPVRQFGHATTTCGESKLVCLGGFGEQNGKHMRLTDVTFVDSRTLGVTVVNPGIDNSKIQVSRMHATLSSIKDGRIILIGGRLSPMKLCNQIVALNVKNQQETSPENTNVESDESNSGNKCEEEMNCLKNENENCSKEKYDENFMNCDKFAGDDVNSVLCEGNSGSGKCKNGVIGATNNSSHKNSNKSVCDMESSQPNPESSQSVINNTIALQEFVCDNNFIIECSVIEPSGEIPCPRWRHSAVLFEDEKGEETVMIFGGRTQSDFALGDCYKFLPNKAVWSKVQCTGQKPCARHSHTASLWNNHMIIAGGLQADLRPLSSVFMLDLQTSVWRMLSTKLKPRYSHTAHVSGDFLILLGGVNCQYSPPGIAVVHLPTGQSSEFPLPKQNKDNLIMLHRHTSVTRDDSTIMILGGGGNCFSFGTHLNSSPIVIDVSKAIEKMKSL